MSTQPNKSENHFFGYKLLLSIIPLMFSVAALSYAINNSWFLGQDFDHLVLLQSTDFITYLLTSIDIHFPLPLHRLACWLLFDVASMNYSLATFLLIATHLASAWYLYKILYTLKPALLATVLATIYSVNFYVLDLFTWWSAGLHRFPYLLLSFIACHHILRLTESGRVLNHLTVIVAAQIIALGFFEKAVFIPIYLAIVLAAQFVIKNTLPNKSQLTAAAITLAISSIYFLVSPRPDQSLPDIHSASIAGSKFLAAYLQSILPSSYNKSLDMYVLAAYLSIAILAAIKNPKLIIFIAMIAAAICANIIPIAYSSRVTLFGTDVLLIHRYFFDMVFILIIFIYVILSASFNNKLNTRATAHKKVSLFILVAFYAAISFTSSSPMVTKFYSENNVGGPAAAAFIKNVKDSIDMIPHPPGETIKVSDRTAPRTLYIPFGTPEINISQLFMFSDFNISFVNENPDYHILDNGRFVREN